MNLKPSNSQKLASDGRKIFGRKKTKHYPIRPGHYRCSQCQEWKEHTAFHQDRSRFNGLHSKCRECNKKRFKDYYQRPEVKARKKAYRQRPEVKARQKAYYQANKDKWKKK